MKAIAIVALTAMISIPCSSFAWGPARGGVVVARPFFPRAVIGRPFFPHVIVGRPFARVPFRFFPNRVAIQSPFFFGRAGMVPTMPRVITPIWCYTHIIATHLTITLLFRLRLLPTPLTIAVIPRDTREAMKRPKKKSIDCSTWRKHRVTSTRKAALKEICSPSFPSPSET